MLVPVLRINDRLRTSSRLAALVTMLLLPCAVATWAYIGAIGERTAFGERERLGMRVLRPALAALAATAQGRAPGLAGLETAVRDNPGLDLARQLRAVRHAASGTDTDTDTASGRARLAAALVDLITQIGNGSNLILDPDLDSYYLVDIQVVQLPRMLLAAVRTADPVAAPGSAALVAEQAVHVGELAGTAGAIRTDAATVVAHTRTRGLHGRLASLEALREQAASLASALSGSLGRVPATAPSKVGDAAAEAVGPLTRELDGLLAARVAGLAERRAATLAVTFAGLAAAAWFAAAVWWRNRSDVGLAVTGVTAIASGDLSERYLPDGRDELGEIGRALDTARRTLAEQDAALRRAYQERETQARTGFERQRRAERQSRERAQQVIDETAAAVLGELDDVMVQLAAVRAATGAIDERVTASEGVTRSVVERARDAGTVVAALEESLRRVADTAGLIAEVADQTNLLAFNATIEAGRAGAAGRGFGVVADEVKELAATTARSTEQITVTVASLGRHAEAMARTITAMVDGIGVVERANAALHEVASDQRASVERLDRAAGEAVQRIRGLTAQTDRLERRRDERVPAGDRVLLHLAGTAVAASMLDINSGGIGCLLDGAFAGREGDTVEVELVLGDERIRVPARIASLTTVGGRGRLGLAFLGVDQRGADLIEAHRHR